MNNYKLTFTLNLNGEDDPAARQQAKALIESLNGSLEAAELKLQQVFKDVPPRNIQINHVTPPALNQDRRNELFRPLGQR